MGELGHLTTLYLPGCELADDRIEPLGKLNRLENLAIGNSPEITDRGIAHLARLAGLKEIGLHGSSISDEACKTLAAFPAIEHINLERTRISDESLKILSTSQTLKGLTFDGCKRLTDQGLESLAVMSSLRWLSIKRTPRITEAAVRKLQAALPNCSIVSDFPQK